MRAAFFSWAVVAMLASGACAGSDSGDGMGRTSEIDIDRGRGDAGTCGHRVTQRSAGEECDDGNRLDGDTCTFDCMSKGPG
jgi:cysteine-rich repeat protein